MLNNPSWYDYLCNLLARASVDIDGDNTGRAKVAIRRVIYELEFAGDKARKEQISAAEKAEAEKAKEASAELVEDEPKEVVSGTSTAAPVVNTGVA